MVNHNVLETHSNSILTSTEAKEKNIEIKPNSKIKSLKWKINSSIVQLKNENIEAETILSEFVTDPPLVSVQLMFPQSLNLKIHKKTGVTVEETLKVIHKKFKNKPDDELVETLLESLDWDSGKPNRPRQGDWDCLLVKLK